MQGQGGSLTLGGRPVAILGAWEGTSENGALDITARVIQQDEFFIQHYHAFVLKLGKQRFDNAEVLPSDDNKQLTISARTHE